MKLDNRGRGEEGKGRMREGRKKEKKWVKGNGRE